MPKRKSEFSDGRELAHRCLATLGLEPAAIERRANREPLWPSGVCGSITHTEGLTAAVVGNCSRVPPATVSLGLDAERVTELDAAADELILTRNECVALASMPVSGRALLATCFFSAKEAFFKAQFPLTRKFVDFGQVSLEPATKGAPSKSGTLGVSHDVLELRNATVSIFHRVLDEYILTGCVIEMNS